MQLIASGRTPNLASLKVPFNEGVDGEISVKSDLGIPCTHCLYLLEGLTIDVMIAMNREEATHHTLTIYPGVKFKDSDGIDPILLIYNAISRQG